MVISRVGDDNENKDIGDPNALVFDENDENTLAFDPTVFRGWRILLISFRKQKVIK